MCVSDLVQWLGPILTKGPIPLAPSVCDHHLLSLSLLQFPRPLTLVKDTIQTRNRKATGKAKRKSKKGRSSSHPSLPGAMVGEGTFDPQTVGQLYGYTANGIPYAAPYAASQYPCENSYGHIDELKPNITATSAFNVIAAPQSYHAHHNNSGVVAREDSAPLDTNMTATGTFTYSGFSFGNNRHSPLVQSPVQPATHSPLM